MARRDPVQLTLTVAEVRTLRAAINIAVDSEGAALSCYEGPGGKVDDFWKPHVRRTRALIRKMLRLRNRLNDEK